MKVMKTLKTLKFWSKKKKKKKTNNDINHHAPPSCCCHNHYDTVQPSAPPLPSWLDYEEQTYNQRLLPSDLYFNEPPGLPILYQAQSLQEDDDSSKDVSSPGEVVESGGSYQQYMVESPVYDVPVLVERKIERSGGYVGCVFNVGAHMFRCVFPCFRIRDV